MATVVLIGAGNVGFHLWKRFRQTGTEALQIYTRSETRAREVEALADCPVIRNFSQLHRQADLYVLAVHDSAIENVAASIAAYIPKDRLVVHTSGATPGSLLSAYFSNFGIFYPLQTFSQGREPDWETIPLCIDGNTESSLAFLEGLARRTARQVYHINDEQRAILHVGAVFVNNFTNHLFGVANHILLEAGLPFDLLKPLIQETAGKIADHDPSAMQTGPAIRGDRQTIARHLQYLERFPKYRELYLLLTKSINPQL